MSEMQIHAYYACFNERRCRDAAALFTPDAIVQHTPLAHNERGAHAYQRFAETWIRAFPDGVLDPTRITARGDTLWEVDLRAIGTHLGALEFGSFGTFKPTGAHAALRLASCSTSGTVTSSSRACRSTCRSSFSSSPSSITRR